MGPGSRNSRPPFAQRTPAAESRRMRNHWAFLAMAALAAVLAPARGGTAEENPQPPPLRLPAVAEPTGYSVSLRIDPNNPSFGGSVDIDVRIREKTDVLWLNGTDLKIEKASSSWTAARTSWDSPSSARSRQAP